MAFTLDCPRGHHEPPESGATHQQGAADLWRLRKHTHLHPGVPVTWHRRPRPTPAQPRSIPALTPNLWPSLSLASQSCESVFWECLEIWYSLRDATKWQQEGQSLASTPLNLADQHRQLLRSVILSPEQLPLCVTITAWWGQHDLVKNTDQICTSYTHRMVPPS